MNKPLRSWWHELNTWDPESAIDFYSRTLGWKFQDTDLPDGSQYWIATKDGTPVGGLFGLTEPEYNGIPAHWMTYMTVDDISQAEKATAYAGGQVTRPSMQIPGVGKLAVVTDVSGALIGLIQPDPAHALSELAEARAH